MVINCDRKLTREVNNHLILSFVAFWAIIGLALTIVYAIIKYFDHD